MRKISSAMVLTSEWPAYLRRSMSSIVLGIGNADVTHGVSMSIAWTIVCLLAILIVAKV